MLAIPPPPHSEADDAEKAGLFSKAFFTDAFHRAKDLFAKVFRVIWKFHEFFLSPVAEGIPLFGSGVTLLTRAIEVLIQATKDYRDIFVKAAELFEQIGFFGMRFEMLMVAESAGVKVPTKFVREYTPSPPPERTPKFRKYISEIPSADFSPLPGPLSQQDHGAHRRRCCVVH